MCKNCTHTHRVEAAWTGVPPATLARNKRLFNLVSNNKELLEKLSTMAQRDIDSVVRTWQKDPELMMQVLQTLTGKPLLTAEKNTDILNKFKDNIGQAYRIGLDAAPGSPQLIPRMIEESVKDNVFKFVTRLDDDTRTELGTKLSDIIEHNRTAEQIDKLMPRDVAQELSKVLDGNVSRAEAIARTETMRSANLASWSQAKAMGATHYTVDSSFEACEECSDTYDGEIYPIDDTDNLPPLHPNCACVPLFGSEEDLQEMADELSIRNEEEIMAEEEKGKEIAPDGSGAYYPEDPMSEYNYDEVSAFEDQIKNSEVENLALFDADGNLIYKNEGGATSVGVEYNKFDELKEAASVATHNHPGELPGLSESDVVSLVKMDLDETRAINSNGDIYSLIKDSGFSKEDTSEINRLQFPDMRGKTDFAGIKEKYEDIYLHSFNKGGMTREEYNALVDHATLQEWAETHNLIYKF